MMKFLDIVKLAVSKAILILSRLFRIDLLSVAHKEIGIIRDAGHITKGEIYLIDKILPRLLTKEKPTFFDVGANIGEYSELLKKRFPGANVVALEPNPGPYKELESNSKKHCFTTVNSGLSSRPHEADLFLGTGKTSKYGSLHQQVLPEIHGIKETEKVRASLTTLDALCENLKIDSIDFIKLDIEGHEFDALKGAGNMLKKCRIGAIQFEFNSVNMIPRIFLKDFYELLPDFDFYRIRSNGLLPLGKYNSMNEIFRVHNIFAVSKNYELNKSFLH